MNLLKTKGILLGTRKREGRQVYVYMFRNLFAEIAYKNDSADEAVEKILIIPGLKKLNDYFEKEIKSV